VSQDNYWYWNLKYLMTALQNPELDTIYILAYSLKARIMESQQPAVTRQQPVNNKTGMVFSARSVSIAAHGIIKYVMPLLSNNRTATEEQCFLLGPC
jgi:hypothetical protein